MKTPACDFLPELTVALNKLPPLKGTRTGDRRGGHREDVDEAVRRQRRRNADEPEEE
jgi:hypothetical protein